MIGAFPAGLPSAAESGLQLSVQGGGSAAVKLFILMTVLSFAAALVVSMTSFTRIIIVLSFMRQALGTPSLPPNQVVIALALALSGYIMSPTASVVWNDALTPYFEDRIDHQAAFERASVPVRAFLLKHTRSADLDLFTRISGGEQPAGMNDVPLAVAVPAFMVSELTTAFRMGLFIFIPMLLIDLLVSAILMSLGMMMVPPTLVALPLKIGVFLLAGGWNVLVGSIVRSFA